MRPDKHEERIQAVFRRAWVNHGWSAATDETPLDVLMAEEYDAERLSAEEPSGDYRWPQYAATSDQMELSALKQEEAAEVAAWARRRLIMWLIGDGLHPLSCVKRLYTMLKARYSEFIGPMDMTALAELVDEEKATFSLRMKRLFTREIKRSTGVMMISPGMKSVESKQSYADAAKKNRPKAGLKPAKLDEGVEKEEKSRLTAKQRAILRRAKADYERRKMAEELGCDPKDINPRKIDPKLNTDDNEQD